MLKNNQNHVPRNQEKKRKKSSPKNFKYKGQIRIIYIENVD